MTRFRERLEAFAPDAKHVIGRTEWDKACVLQVNPGVSYYHCNETLKNVFYDGAWDARRVERTACSLASARIPSRAFITCLRRPPSSSRVSLTSSCTPLERTCSGTACAGIWGATPTSCI